MPSQTSAKRPPRATSASEDTFAWLTQAAFGLSLSLVLARGTFLEVTGQTGVLGRGAGPTAGLILDLLSCLPAFLILLRRIIDRTYVLRWSWSFLLIALLAAWMALSVRWSTDRFSAALGAGHFAAAAVLLWSMAQLVRSWLRLRLIAAALIGLLLLSGIHSIYYKFYYAPQMIKTVQENPADALRQVGFEPDGFMAEQFLAKIRRAELLGFHSSPNSFAAVTVLLGIIAAAWVLQRLRDAESFDYTILLVLATLALGVTILVWTGSKAALVTAVLAAILLSIVARRRDWLAAHWRRAYLAAIALLLLGAAAFVLLALLRHGNLFVSSLTFRWNYWVGAARVFIHHKLLGVGWGNFPDYYLAVRVPVASEEIKDPHNFLIHFFVELGLIGGILAFAWLLRLWWELTRPTTQPAPPAGPSAYRPVVWLAVIALIVAIINLAASVDFSQDPVLELMQRIVYFAALYIAAVATAVRSLTDPQADARPAPWILWGILIALGLFLLHNLIEFSLFEPGPMMLFALLAGSALGLRFPSIAGAKRRKWVTGAALAAGFALWAIVAALFVVPVAEAEALAAQADDAAAKQPPRYATAFELLHDAWLTLPINADYAFRASDMAVRAGMLEQNARTALADAIRSNPRAPEYYQRRAELELHSRDRDPHRITEDYQTAITLNPNDIPTRLRYGQILTDLRQPDPAEQQFREAQRLTELLERDDPRRNDATIDLAYAKALEQMGKTDAALTQYRAALQYSQNLKPADPRKLTARQTSDLEQKIRQLGGP